jgi:anthranilate 1,2-dioxygenase small subunit
MLAPDEAERAILRLMLDYTQCIDDGEYERWPELFTEKCLYQVICAEDHALGRPIGFWFCDNRDMLIDRVRSLRSVNVFEPHRYRHVVGPSALERVGAGFYHARTSYMVARIMQDGATDLFSTGSYEDKILFEGDRPRFRERIVVCDSRRISNLLVLPL